MEGMDFDEVKLLLEKLNWVLESESPLEIRSKDGEHFAKNFAAELVIEYFAGLDDDTAQEFAEQFKPIEQDDTTRTQTTEQSA